MEQLKILINKEDEKYVFSNYLEIKEIVEEIVNEYIGKEYSSLEEAIKDRDILKTLKEQIVTKQKEIEEPYSEIISQLTKLSNIIQEPIKNINKIEKEFKHKQKCDEIIKIAYEMSEDLGNYKDKIINSQSFIENEWLTSKFDSQRKLKDSIEEKISNAIQDINSIINFGGKNCNAILARYYETLSLDNVNEFINSMNYDSGNITSNIKSKDNIVEYKVLKIYGTSSQLNQITNSIDLLGLEYEELENGFPNELEEVYEPKFDSFIAFDTENTGSLGVDDEQRELTEIGAVKVINGEIVERKDWLINPNRKIVPRISRLTNITDDMLKNCPTIDTVIKEFKEFVYDMTLVGHNIKAADLSLIIRDGKKYGVAFSNTYFDTNKYAKKFIDKLKLENTKLEYLSGIFGIEDQSHHRADNDAEVNAKVYLAIKNIK